MSSLIPHLTPERIGRVVPPAATSRYRIRVQWSRSYEVSLVSGLLDRNFDEVTKRLEGKSGLLVCTPTVAGLYGRELCERLDRRGIRFPLVVIRGGEANKSLAQVERVCAEALERGLDRTSLLLALGGGVCSDIVSMAAAWIRRGIRTARIPTTLVGQIDAAIGVKGGVNFQARKSALGCFYPPEWVLVDPAFLASLPTDEIKRGFAEIAKIAIVRDAELFDLIEQHGVQLIQSRFTDPVRARDRVLRRAIEGMLDELQPNILEDQTYRRRVDFGHIFSPLLEARSGYGLTHGEAVAVDMALTSCVATRLGHMDPVARDRVLEVLTQLGLPTSSSLLTDDLLEEALLESQRHRGGKLNLVVPQAIGRSWFLDEIDRLPLDLLTAARDDLAGRAAIPLHCTPRRRTLVFDVGGSLLRAGVYRQESASLSDTHVLPTPSSWNLPERRGDELYALVLDALLSLGARALNGEMPSRVAVAFPGPIDRSGRVLAAPTIWGSAVHPPLDLAADLRRKWTEARIDVLNDVTAAGYRYLRNPEDSFCIVTVSSGIGNKVFIAGEPQTGPGGRGGEIGHVRADAWSSQSVCECGGDGHIGAISSGRGTLLEAIRRASAQRHAFASSFLGVLVGGQAGLLTNEVIATAFHAVDEWTVNLVRDTSAPLGRALAMIHAAVGIERFVIVGGFALAMGERYRKELVRHAAGAAWDAGQEWNSMIELGTDDDLSGLLGAGRFVTEFARR